MKYNQLVNIEAKTTDYPNRRFQLEQDLGSGSEGTAYLATAYNWGNNPQQVVIKVQKNMRDNEKDFLIKLIQYQNCYENGNNQQHLPSHLIKIYECFQWKENHCIVMEVGQESLYEYMGKNQNLSMQERVKICFQICHPILFLHQQKLIHRDIKPENYLKVGDIFKLINFGLIRSSISDNKTQKVGTAIFQAPEILGNSSSYTEKVDIWSLGCVFYEILASQALFDGINTIIFEGTTYQQVISSIQNHKSQPHITNNKIKNLQTSLEIKEILIKMLEYQENARPTIDWVFAQFQKQVQTPTQVPPLLQKQIITPPQKQPSPPKQTIPPFPKQIIQLPSQTLPSPQIKKQASPPKYPVEDNQKLILEQIFSKLNLLENQVKEKDNQIQALNQSLANIEKQLQVEKDQQKLELQSNIDEQNKFNLNQIDSLKQQISQEKLHQNNNLDEKLKQFEQKVTEQQNKIQDLDKKYITELDINYQNQKLKQEIATEQQNLINKQEDKHKVELKKEISEQNSQMQKIFKNQSVEIKQNFEEQLNSLNQNQLHSTESQIKIENKNKIIQINTIIDEWEHYKTKVNSVYDKIQVIDQEFIKKKVQLIENNFKLELEQSNEKNNALEKSNKDLTKQLVQSNEKNNTLDNSNKDLTKQLVQSNEKNNTLDNSNKDLTKQLVQSNEKNNTLDNSNKDLTKQLVQSNEKNNKLENSNKDLTKQLQDTQQQFKEFKESSIKENQSLKSELQNLQKKTQEDKVRQSQEVDKFNKTIKELQEKDKKQNLENSTQNKKLQEFQQQILSLQNQLNQANKPVNQILALTNFFKNPKNLTEFQENYSKEYQELVESINSC